MGGDPPARIDPTTFSPPTPRAGYYDPALGSTQPATVVEATAGGGQARFEVGAKAFTLTDLLAPEGAVLVFATPVPEPGVVLGLFCGAAFLLAIARLRRVPAAPTD